MYLCLHSEGPAGRFAGNLIILRKYYRIQHHQDRCSTRPTAIMHSSLWTMTPQGLGGPQSPSKQRTRQCGQQDAFMSENNCKYGVQTGVDRKQRKEILRQRACLNSDGNSPCSKLWNLPHVDSCGCQSDSMLFDQWGCDGVQHTGFGGRIIDKLKYILRSDTSEVSELAGHRLGSDGVVDPMTCPNQTESWSPWSGKNTERLNQFLWMMVALEK